VLRIESEQDVIAIREAFEREYAEAYSPLGLNPEAGIEIQGFMLRGRVQHPKPELPRYGSEGEDPRAAQVGERPAYWSELGWKDTSVYRQDALKCGNVVVGPALIEAEDTTIVVEPDWTFRIGEYMDGIMEFTGRRESDATSAAVSERTPTASTA
jgi:N-methylhydantoinase A/acetophenone carboxylase